MVSGYPSGAQRATTQWKGVSPSGNITASLASPSSTGAENRRTRERPRPRARPDCAARGRSQLSARSAPPITPTVKMRGRQARPSQEGVWPNPNFRHHWYCLPDLSTLSLSPKDDDATSSSSVSSVAATSWDDVPKARTPTPTPTPRQDDDTHPDPAPSDDAPRSLPSEQTEPLPPPRTQMRRVPWLQGLMEPPPPRPAFVTTLKAKPPVIKGHTQGAPWETVLGPRDQEKILRAP
ncbi:hypothetical protein B0H14DRAFT_3544170 [Mycena olivaceomarginata]|nr:hypothetical protein B0H14DRAFT_3544170 [Mycena olivaceomarginata]